MASTLVKNDGSAARDYCMLERNLLSHLKLALLLSLLSASFLLRTRLFPNSPGDGGFDYEVMGLPLSIVLYAAGVITVTGGVWEFRSGHQDFRAERAFLSAPKYVRNDLRVLRTLNCCYEEGTLCCSPLSRELCSGHALRFLPQARHRTRLPVRTSDKIVVKTCNSETGRGNV